LVFFKHHKEKVHNWKINKKINTKEVVAVSSLSASLAGEALGGFVAGAGVGELLDAAPGVGLELPCRSGNPDLWFAESPAELERAKQLCGSCPVRAECLAAALARHEPWGVWGGEIFERGTVIARKRPRGRPRKEDKAREIAAQAVSQDKQEVAA